MADDIKILRTPPGILTYPHLFELHAIDKDKPDDKFYSTSILFDAAAQATAEWADLRAEANRVALARFGDALPALVASGEFKSPFLLGDKFAAKNPEAAGKIMLRLKTKMKPGIVNDQVLPITDPSKVYPGVIAILSVGCYAYPLPGASGPKAANKGVSFGLRNVQIVRDGTPLGNISRADMDFVPLGDKAQIAGNDPAALF